MTESKYHTTESPSPSSASTPRLRRTPAVLPPTDAAKGTSLFVNGFFPRRRALILMLAAIGGFLMTYVWSAQLVDRVIGFNVANGILGHDANSTPISSVATGVIFAFVTGFAGSFTACNIAAFGAVGPMIGRASSRRDKFVQTIKPLGWLALGMIPMSALYGVIVGLVGTGMPQFATAETSGISARAIQSMIAFGVVGLVMLTLALAALGLIPDPMAAISRRLPSASMILMGVLIGGFLIGRPYPLFRDMFRHAAVTHDPLFGAAAFALQSIGNVIVMAVLFVGLSLLLGRRLQRWLAEKPSRAATLTAATFVVVGVFMLLYWDVRPLDQAHAWFPRAPWS